MMTTVEGLTIICIAMAVLVFVLAVALIKSRVTAGEAEMDYSAVMQELKNVERINKDLTSQLEQKWNVAASIERDAEIFSYGEETDMSRLGQLPEEDMIAKFVFRAAIKVGDTILDKEFFMLNVIRNSAEQIIRMTYSVKIIKPLEKPKWKF